MQRAPSTMSLLCFEASARLHSFTTAAQELHLTQSAVSRQIKELERRLAFSLFVRRRDALVLTEGGRFYLKEIVPILQRLERATTEAVAFQGRGGSLSLSVGTSLGNYWLIPRLPDFTKEHGEITLNLFTSVGPVNFAATSVDASLEFGTGPRAGLCSDYVMPLVLAPYAAPSWIAKHGAALTHETPPASLIRLYTFPDGWKDWFEFAAIHPAPDSTGPRYELLSMALNATIAGLGTVLLPPFMADDAVSDGRLRRLSPKNWGYPGGYYLVYPRESADMKALGVFREWVLGRVKERQTA
jgi:LysR family transcriptional regulator, glycine cleavage system transcriptional activator